MRNDFLRIIGIPLVTSLAGIFVKWATKPTGSQRFSREYLDLGFQWLLTALVLMFAFTVDFNAEQRRVDTQTRLTTVQLIAVYPELTDRLTNPDIPGAVDICSRLHNSYRFRGIDFQEFALEGVANGIERLRVGNCRTLLLSEARSRRIGQFLSTAPYYVLLIVVAMWVTSAIVQQWGYPTSEGDENTLSGLPKPTPFVGILMPDVLGLTLLILVFAVSGVD